ncbi:MAG: hypothetical protein WAL72_06490 [Streptosporangiaceae bacterium]
MAPGTAAARRGATGLQATAGGHGLNYCTAEAMGAALLLGEGTIGLADIAGAVQDAAGVASKAGTRKTRKREKKIRRRRRSSAGRGRGHRVLSTHRADGGTARRGAAA